MVSKSRLQVKGHLCQGHTIFRIGVKLNNPKVLKVSLRSAAFYASYLRKTEGGSHQPPVPARVNPIQAEGLFAPAPSGFSCAIPKCHKPFSPYLVNFPKKKIHCARFSKNKNVWSGQGGSLDRVGCFTSERVFHGAISSLQIFSTVPVCVICRS